MKKNEVFEYIRSINKRKELDEIAEQVKQQYEYVTLYETSNFYEGQNVWWTNKGYEYSGRIKSVNKKSISVREAKTKRMWRIHPYYLSGVPLGEE